MNKTLIDATITMMKRAQMHFIKELVEKFDRNTAYEKVLNAQTILCAVASTEYSFKLLIQT